MLYTTYAALIKSAKCLPAARRSYITQQRAFSVIIFTIRTNFRSTCTIRYTNFFMKLQQLSDTLERNAPVHRVVEQQIDTCTRHAEVGGASRKEREKILNAVLRNFWG